MGRYLYSQKNSVKRNMGQSIQEWTKQTFLKTVFHQILLGPFLNTLTHIYLRSFLTNWNHLNCSFNLRDLAFS